jgi:TPP-dependent indolepyruvate ferredoxin oxidoreductase alpha subunit
MNLLHLSILLLITILHPLNAQPIPSSSSPQSFSLRRYLPTLGSLAILATLSGIVVLGTKADQAYESLKTLEKSDAVMKYNLLSPEERKYLCERMKAIEVPISEEERSKIEMMDKEVGWPKVEMPDLGGVSTDVRREVEGVYTRLTKALEKVGTLEEINRSTRQRLERTTRELEQAQLDAAFLLATEWKQILQK